jgi:hypothetical protein
VGAVDGQGVKGVARVGGVGWGGGRLREGEQAGCQHGRRKGTARKQSEQRGKKWESRSPGADRTSRNQYVLQYKLRCKAGEPVGSTPSIRASSTRCLKDSMATMMAPGISSRTASVCASGENGSSQPRSLIVDVPLLPRAVRLFRIRFHAFSSFRSFFNAILRSASDIPWILASYPKYVPRTDWFLMARISPVA